MLFDQLIIARIMDRLSPTAGKAAASLNCVLVFTADKADSIALASRTDLCIRRTDRFSGNQSKDEILV